MDSFEEGYDYFSKYAGTQAAAGNGGVFVGNIEEGIEILENDLNAQAGKRTPPPQFKGNIAEIWHSDTFNINAIVRGSDHRTHVEESYDFASVDVSSNYGPEYQIKYYQTGEKSATALSKSLKDRFDNYKGPETQEEWLVNRGFDTHTNMNNSMYSGAVGVVPTDQLQEAIAQLEKKIAKESINNPDQVKRYSDILKTITDKISDSEGVESIPLTEGEATTLAQLAEEGAISKDLLKELGVSAAQLIRFEDIIRESFKAGMSAATISLVLNVAPVIYKAIYFLIENGELDEDQFQKIGFAALRGGSEGFIRGNISAALTISCRSGLLGEACRQIDPNIIGAVTVVAIDTMQNAFLVATGKMDSREMAEDLIREMYLTTCSLIGGGLTQAFIQVPGLGYMLGSFLGSVIGAFTYDIGYNAALSFCVESGFTMFGLVDQDYELPLDVVKEIGIDIFDYDKIEPDIFKAETFTPEKFSFDEFTPETLDIKMLRRGVIGVRRIGYV